MTPLFAAVLICWIFSVCVHEFAHALVAYLGGDKSVKDKGYLHFNIFAFVHPVTSILLPAVFLMMGGVPLPGGAVYINRMALRSRHWSALVSAAGPASNFILFLILAAIVHPRTGIVDPTVLKQPMWVMLLCAMTVLQLFAVFFNLIPIPPLDGYGMIEPYLTPEARARANALGWTGLVILYLALSYPPIRSMFMDSIDTTLKTFGIPFENSWRYFNFALFGSSE
jgi:Zn-dependent protease